MSMDIASFSGQKVDLNSEVKSVQSAKAMTPVLISCLTIHSANVAACPDLKNESAQWMRCSGYQSFGISKIN
jgi:hypothetical protein